MFRAITILVLAVSLIPVSGCRKESISVDQVIQVLDSLEHKFEWLNYRLSEEMWDWYSSGRADSLKFYQGLYNTVVSDDQTLRTLQNGRRSVSSESDLRRFDLIFATMLRGRVESNPNIVRLRDSLTDINLTFRPEFEGERRTSNELYQIYCNEPDPVRREIAFRAWCQVGLEIGDGLERLIRQRNQMARKAGYNNFLALLFAQKHIKSEEYLGLLRRLDSLSEPVYGRILEGIRSKLNRKEIEIWDLGYANADLRNEVDYYFPVDSQMIIIKRSLKAIGFNLDKLPIYFDLDSREGKSQFATAFSIKPPYDMRVLANLSDGLYSTRVLMHEIGHALHSAHIAQERDLFATTIDSIWAEGMAQIWASLVDEKGWLQQYGHLPASLIDRHLASLRDREIIYLRTTLARLHFEFEAYQNPNRNLNTVYWDLFERYMDLPRHDDIKPWAAAIHYTTRPGYLQNYLYADMITAQTLDFIQKNYTSMVNNPTVGSFLIQNYFRSGSRYKWPELLKRGTDSELNPQFLVEKLGL